MQQAAVKAGGILVSYIHIETGNESKYKHLQEKYVIPINPPRLAC